MNALSIAAFAVALAAWVSYMPVSKSPRLRKTMWPTIGLMGVAFLLIAARVLTRSASDLLGDAIDISTLTMTLIFLPVYFFVLRVPRSSGRPQVGQILPMISFMAEDGRAISSSELVQRGPLLLVFFRGFW